jgi:hypothetical protein
MAADEIEKVRGEVLYFVGENLDAVLKVIIRDNGGNRSRQPERRGDQRLADSGSDDRKSCGPLGTDVAKRIHDPPNGSKKTDKRGRAGRRSQKSGEALEV